MREVSSDIYGSLTICDVVTKGYLDVNLIIKGYTGGFFSSELGERLIVCRKTGLWTFGNLGLDLIPGQSQLQQIATQNHRAQTSKRDGGVRIVSPCEPIRTFAACRIGIMVATVLAASATPVLATRQVVRRKAISGVAGSSTLRVVCTSVGIGRLKC